MLRPEGMGHNSLTIIHTLYRVAKARACRSRSLLRRSDFTKIPNRRLLSKDLPSSADRSYTKEHASLAQQTGTVEHEGNACRHLGKQGSRLDTPAA